MSALKILHTSDWHLGQQLHGKKRDDEFSSFLNWLVSVIDDNKVDILLVSGDIFDNGSPGAQAQKLYYDFLFRASLAGVKHIVITAGNHDSPSFLAAPKEILSHMQVHVVGAFSGNVEDEIFLLRDETDKPMLIVCAAPFLRERDVRESSPGESIDEKERKLASGIREHYASLARAADNLRGQADIPIIAMGHLYTAGGTAGDGVRELYIGTLGHVGHDIFSPLFDYVALGHLHRPQKIGGLDYIRYSGSPLPMSLAEACQQKEIVLASFENGKRVINPLPVPRFRNFMSISGNRAQILEKLHNLVADNKNKEIWLGIFYDGDDSSGLLGRESYKIVENTQIKILLIKPQNSTSPKGVARVNKSIAEIKPEEMFSRLLERKNPPDKEDMLDAFKELLAIWNEEQRDKRN